MAIEYNLDLATGSSALEVAIRLAAIGRENDVFDTSVTGEQLVDKNLFRDTRLGTTVHVAQQRPPQPWDPISTDLGFTRTVGVMFRLGKQAEVSEQQDDMIRLVAPLLESVDGDGVLHFQFEKIWLLRRNGELSLSEDDELWPPRRLALVPQSYCRETHVMDSVWSD